MSDLSKIFLDEIELPDLPDQELNVFGEDYTIRYRIKKFVQVKLGDVAHNPHNWKIHTDEAKESLAGVIDDVGFNGVPLVYFSELTGTITFVDGHRRKETMPGLIVWAAFTDLTDDEVDKVLITYDPLAGEAETNVAKMIELLRNFQTDNAGLQAFLGRIAERNHLYVMTEADGESLEEIDAPDDFPEFGEDIETEYCCPKCGYEWSGKPK